MSSAPTSRMETYLAEIFVNGWEQIRWCRGKNMKEYVMNELLEFWTFWDMLEQRYTEDSCFHLNTIQQKSVHKRKC